MKVLLMFLSDFPFFKTEKKLFTYLEDFLKSEFKINSLLVFSNPLKTSNIELSKCRFILGKKDKISLYNLELINELLKKYNKLKNIQASFIKLNVDDEETIYYYLKLGQRGDQSYFSIFSTVKEISPETLSCLSKFTGGHLKIVGNIETLTKEHELIHIDDVTGLYNQRKLYKDLTRLIDNYHSEKDLFSVLFIDIDHFKKVNDQYGHLVGTRLLEQVSRDIKCLLRESDISYRYGGDEFVVILIDSNSQTGKIVGERILSKICQTGYLINGSINIKNNNSDDERLRLSVSIGVAEYPTDAKSAQDILALADKMMYEAKESGRGLVFNTQDVFNQNKQK